VRDYRRVRNEALLAVFGIIPLGLLGLLLQSLFGRSRVTGFVMAVIMLAWFFTAVFTSQTEFVAVPPMWGELRQQMVVQKDSAHCPSMCALRLGEIRQQLKPKLTLRDRVTRMGRLPGQVEKRL